MTKIQVSFSERYLLLKRNRPIENVKIRLKLATYSLILTRKAWLLNADQPFWRGQFTQFISEDITVRGLKIVKRCAKVYLESYTSILSHGYGVDIHQLENFYGREVIEADRTFVEQGCGRYRFNLLYGCCIFRRYDHRCKNQRDCTACYRRSVRVIFLLKSWRQIE